MAWIRTWAACLLVAVTCSTTAWANDFAPQMIAYYTAKLKPALADPALIAAIKAQNARHADLTEAQIDVLDKQWRAEAKAGKGPLVDGLLTAPVSAALRALKAAHKDVVVELFVMDAKGLNVAQADLTSDYMQGDEAKWQKTFAVGPAAVFVDEVDFDDSSKTFQAQLSATLVDPADGKAIGAVTVGMAVESLP